MLNGLVKSIALDLDVKSVANSAKASMDSKIAEVGADIELLTRGKHGPKHLWGIVPLYWRRHCADSALEMDFAQHAVQQYSWS
jgi:hypothetical protein